MSNLQTPLKDMPNQAVSGCRGRYVNVRDGRLYRGEDLVLRNQDGCFIQK